MKICLKFLAVAMLFLSGCGEGKKTEMGKEPLDSIQLSIQQVNEEIKLNPGNDALYIKRAKLHQKRGDFNSAYMDAVRAVSLDSTKSENYLELGNFALAVLNFYRTEEAYLRCIKADPKNTDCISKLAEFYLYRKSYDDAMRYSNAALKINQQLYRPYYIKSWVYLKTGDTAKAVSSLQTAVELNPDFYEGFMKLGELYSSIGKDLAIDYYNSALAIKKGDPDALYNKGMYYQEKGRYDEAMLIYDELIAADGSNAKAYYNKGYIKLTVESQFDSAVFFFTRAIERKPDYYQAYYNRGFSKELMGQKVQAANDYKVSLSINKDYNLAAEGLDRVQ